MESQSLISLFFLFIGILLTIRNIGIYKNYNYFFWFCDFVTFLLAISFYLGYFQLVKALINIGLIGQITAWVYHIPNHVITLTRGKKKINFKEKYCMLVEGLVHITLPISFIITYNIAPTIKSLIYSAIILSIMFISVLMFTPKKENINALYYLELGRKETGIKKFYMPFHTPLWVIYGFLMCIANFLIQFLLYYLTLK